MRHGPESLVFSVADRFGCEYVYFSSGLGEFLALKPAERCLAAEFSVIFAGDFLGDSSSEPWKVSPVSTTRIPAQVSTAGCCGQPGPLVHDAGSEVVILCRA